MKGREIRRAPSADLLVCFPSRAHLTLMPKPICSPARPSETSKPRQNRHHHQQQRHHHSKKSSTRGVGIRASPLLWAKAKQMGSELIQISPVMMTKLMKSTRDIKKTMLASREEVTMRIQQPYFLNGS
ncbi:hypothetical protein NC652_014106 [Populus alba x Populus x berolinensis]|nr:hypothetical protein NC652_014106 [Populus alba x Populus x berolinensis]